MPATFSPSLDTALDRLRFSLGDTDTSAPLLDDETYTAALDRYEDDEGEALSFLRSGLMASYAHKVDYKAGTESESLSDRFKNFQAATENGLGGSGGGFMVITPVRLSECSGEFG
jgi:hypothetical protein